MAGAGSSGWVRTVTGDLAAERLGGTDYHEHAFHHSPLLPADTLDDPSAAVAEFRLLAESFDAVVDATPIGLGRRSADLATVARETGLTVLASTGRHRDAHYAEQPWLLELDEDRLAEILTRELTVGLARDDDQYRDRPPAEVETAGGAERPVRAGVLKAGIDYWSISPAERGTLAAVARAQRSTGAPVMVHTERCSAAHELLDLLAEHGVEPARVAIAHADRNPDPGLHAELAARGAFLGYDGAGRHKEWPDSVLIALTADLVRAGHGDRILLGNDLARRSSWVVHDGLPGLGYLGRRYLPRLARVVGQDAVTRMVRNNAADWLAWRPAGQGSTMERAEEPTWDG